jgi:hypothetical protein
MTRSRPLSLKYKDESQSLAPPEKVDELTLDALGQMTEVHPPNPSPEPSSKTQKSPLTAPARKKRSSPLAIGVMDELYLDPNLLP